jgi:hypothetical protein
LAQCNGVRAAYAADDIVRDDLADIAERYRALTCDPRMRGVWRELSRQRCNGCPLYPARGPSQQAAMLEIFKTAFECRYLDALPTRAEAERQRRHYLAKAKELEWDAMTMMTQRLSAESGLLSQPATIEDSNLPSQPATIEASDDDLLNELAALLAKEVEVVEDEGGALGGKLLAAAEAYKKYARAIYRAQPSLPQRECDIHARLVALRISARFRELFGSPMYGLTAIIASIVLNRRVDPRTVRHWAEFGGTSYPCS